MLGYHARSLVCVDVSFFTLDVGYMEVAIYIWALVDRVVYIVATCISVPKVIILLDNVGVGGASIASSAASSPSSSAV